jgi:hypothetical protein
MSFSILFGSILLGSIVFRQREGREFNPVP